MAESMGGSQDLAANSKADFGMDDAPKDKNNFVLGTMFLFGITALLPWNFFITATDYWNYKFRNPDNDSLIIIDPSYKTELQSAFTSYLAIASKVPFVFFLMVNTIISARIRPSKRIGYPLIGCIVLFCVTTALVYVNTDHKQNTFLGVTLACVACINVVAAFLQGGGSGLAGAFPPKYMTSNVYGQAVGGVFASVVQILTLVGNTSPQASALAYFIIALFTLVITLVAFLYLLKTPFYMYYISTQVGQNSNKKDQHTSTSIPVLTLSKKIAMHACSTIVIFWVTLTVFPAVVVLIDSMDKNSMDITGKYYLPVACFLVFSVGDIIGRVLGSWKPLPSDRTRLLLVLSILRVVFVPIFMLCNAHPDYTRNTPVVFNSDYYFVLFIILFSISNGYLYTIAMTNGPKMVPVEYQEAAGSMMAFCLGAGLMLGSVTSLGIIKLL